MTLKHLVEDLIVEFAYLEQDPIRQDTGFLLVQNREKISTISQNMLMQMAIAQQLNQQHGQLKSASCLHSLFSNLLLLLQTSVPLM